MVHVRVRSQAATWLRTYLAHGDQSSKDALRAGAVEGFRQAAVYQAAQDLGVISTRVPRTYINMWSLGNKK